MTNMTNDIDAQEKTSHGALYYFICNCGCGGMSEQLGKEYCRLRKSQKWYAKGCEKEKEIVREFKGGFIVKEEDF